MRRRNRYLQPILFGTRHHRLDAPRHIAPQQRQPPAPPDPMQQRPRAAWPCFGVMFIAGLHIHPQHQTKVRHLYVW